MCYYGIFTGSGFEIIGLVILIVIIIFGYHIFSRMHHEKLIEAINILNIRLVKGEISEDEYQNKKSILKK